MRLGNVDIQPQAVRLRDPEQERAAFIHQRAGIDVAHGDDAGKRSAYRLVALQLVEPREIRLCGGGVAPRRGHGLPERLNAGLLRCELGLVRVIVLPRYHSLCQQVGVALRVDLGEVGVGLPLFQRGFGLLHVAVGLVDGGSGLLDLLLEFGGLDLGQHLAGVHAVADIHIALADVAAGAREHRRFRDRLYVAWQQQAGVPAGPRHALHVDHREGGSLHLGLGRQHLFPALPRKIAQKVAGGQKSAQNQEQHQKRAALGAGARRRLMLQRFQLLPESRDFRAQLIFGGVDLVHCTSSRRVISSLNQAFSSSAILRS